MTIRTARDLVAYRNSDALVSNIIEADVTVGTTAIWLAPRGGAIIERIITNNGAAAIAISTLTSVTATKGIQLAAGGTLSFQALEDFDLATCDLYAISSGAGNSVHVISVQLVGA
jgi:hypothetical protein